MAQYVTIQNDWDSPKFHCPACGTEVYNEHGGATDKPCEHLLFSWINEIGEFDNLAEEVKDLLEDDEDGFSPWDDEFLSRCPETAVLFGLESRGMACGPVSMTVIHAIKFPEANSDQDDIG